MEHLSQPDQPKQVLADEPLTTKEGWARFVDRRPTPPAAGNGTDTDDARIDYLSELVMVNTPVVAEVVTTARRLVLLNRRQLSARRGLIVTGVPGTGKTTAITALGRTHEVAVRRRHPHEKNRLPVVYVTVPPAATPRMLAVEFARFFGLPLGRRANITDVTNAVCATAAHVGVELVLVDKVHNLNLATRAGAEVSDQLKYFAERLPATFIYAGVNVERVGLFASPRGQQLASRFTTIPTTAFAYGTADQRAAWHALVASLEATLPLRAHQPRTLAALDEYLHRRTAGMIGSLSHLVRGAAIDAILDGTEHLTRAHLDRVRRDPPQPRTGATGAGRHDRMIRRLPITVRPAQQETVTSYVRRLAALHSIGYRDLWQHLSASVPYSGTSKRRQLIVAQRLVAATGHQLAALAHAMPELRDPAPRWRELRHLPQRACPVCTARHPDGPVVRFFAHHEFVCTRHGYWIGPPVPTIPDLRPRQLARLVPELVTAQRRHTRLLRRQGWRHVFNAFDVSIAVCVDRRFQQRIDVPGRRSWQERIDLLIPTRTRFNTSVFLAAFYPEIVNLARLFCSPTWRAVARRALTSAEHRLTITAEISRQIGPEPVPP